MSSKVSCSYASYFTKYEMIAFIVISAFAICCVCGYCWLKHRYRYWEIRQIPYVKPESLFFGNNFELVTGKLSMAESSMKHYNDLAPHRYGGVYHFYKPELYIRDPELIKDILIKDFHHFHDHSFDFANKDDPLSQHLFNLVGDEWKILRNKLTPTFTSGKMKILFELMKECAAKLTDIIDKSIPNRRPIEVKDLMARFTIDVISSCAFGLEADMLHDANSIFREKLKERFSPSLRARLRDAMMSMCPGLIRFLRYQEVSRNVSDFFINLVSDTIEYRKKNGVVRNDFLHLLMALQNEEKEETKKLDFNTGLLTAQCFVFFVAGFETSSNMLSVLLYELAEHQDVQKKLQEEVDEILKKHNGQITYDSLQEMHYLGKVFNETLRLFPPAPRLQRICTADYPIPDSDHVVKRGQLLILPIVALHKDPKYFPNPETFNPENFSEEAKASRPNCCFLPFGAGPRFCIAKRFAIMEIKLALVMIMKEYAVTSSPETIRPLKLTPYIVISTLKNEMLLHFNKRGVV